MANSNSIAQRSAWRNVMALNAMAHQSSNISDVNNQAMVTSAWRAAWKMTYQA